MSRRGNRKHKCDECGNIQWVHWTARARRAPERCTACGRTCLIPVTDGGKEDIVAEARNLNTGPKGSVAGSNSS